MKKLFINEHVYSFIHTFITELLWDAMIGGSVLHIFLEKDFSKTTLYAVGYAIFRTFFRLFRETYFKREAAVVTPQPVDTSLNP